jgi:cytochrome c oxidase cbb3-type subunit III
MPIHNVDAIVRGDARELGRLFGLILFIFSSPGICQAADTSIPEDSQQGRALYQRYCATCHGIDGAGNVAERANALRSPSFLSTVSDEFLRQTIRYGRPATAMSGYHQSVGGPLNDGEINALVKFIKQLGTVEPVRLQAPPLGNANRGLAVYQAHCASCHGAKGEGITAPSLNDPLFLKMAGPAFIRYAIEHGREGTKMQGFHSVLSAQQLDDVTAHVGSWALPWNEPTKVRPSAPRLSENILNPSGAPPQFGSLKGGRYVSPEALKAALDSKARLLLLDARVPSAWARGHIPGGVTFPYYDIPLLVSQPPKDGVWIAVYCACPTHLANEVVDQLREHGIANTAVLDEGYPGWVARGYPVATGDPRAIAQPVGSSTPTR